MTAFVGTLKDHLRHYPWYEKVRTWYKVTRRNKLFLQHAFREGLWRPLFGVFATDENFGLQHVLQWDVPWPQFDTPGQLVAWLREHNLQVNEGQHTLYIPPQDGLEGLLPSVLDFYPPQCGFKILKDFRSPDEANYLAGRNQLLGRTKLVGTPQAQLITANYLYSLGIGPRVWDVCGWRSSTCSYTVFVVQHIAGNSPTSTQHTNFIKRLKEVLSSSQLHVLLANWEQARDFRGPDCNRNLVQSESLGLQYVDFQNFCLTNPGAWSNDIIAAGKERFHFGAGRPLRGAKYLYQSVPGMTGPGKRNTSKRWQFIVSQLQKAGLNFVGRVVLDIGCNAGMILHSSLVEGAAWALGWDRPLMVPYTQELLLSLGASRFSLVGADLNPSYPIEKDIPENLGNRLTESVIFYLSVHKHIGVLQSLQQIPWRVLVYEGHQGERLQDIPQILSPLLAANVRCVESASIADGDSAARPVVLLVRE